MTSCRHFVGGATERAVALDPTKRHIDPHNRSAASQTSIGPSHPLRADADGEETAIAIAVVW
jgi:hypothetical protein